MSRKRYVVITPQLIGSPEDWSTSYWSDLQPFADRQVAIDYGVQALGHDDFCIGTVREGQLVAYGWGLDDFDPDDRDDLAEIARQIELYCASWIGSDR